MASVVFSQSFSSDGDNPRLLTGLATQLYIHVIINDRLGFAQPETPMKFILQPWQLMLIILASWVNRQQQEVIEYLRTENSILKEKFGEKRILLTDDQRRRLAVKGKLLGRKQLEQVGTLFTPDTILRWHRQLVANRWDYLDRKEKKSGRPRIRQVIVDLTVKFAKENPTWGYDRISGALSNVGYNICDSTSGKSLKPSALSQHQSANEQGYGKHSLKRTGT